MINRQDLEKILETNDIIDKKQAAILSKESQGKGKSLESLLFQKKLVSPEKLYQLAAKHFNLPFIDLKNKTVRKDILLSIPEATAQTHKIIAFDKTDTTLRVATLDVDNIELFDFLAKKNQLKIEVSLTTPENITEALKHYHRGLNAEFKSIKKTDKKDSAKKGQKSLKNLAQDLPVIRIINTLLEYAILEKASDIHIEPAEKEIEIRYRVDGILQKVMTLPKTVHAGIIARIKILADLKLDEHRMPQDGRFKINTNETKVAFRVSIMPTFDGEKAVLRLLPDNNQQLTLEELGFQPSALKIVRKNIKKPHGMILVTGPTGSGKTTTLYTVLNILNKPEVNISTIEDPIEYRMPGINQSQVHQKIGFTFAVGLRAFLRQDPDIIMVGEIRDRETAEIGINAAMTGHLVLSTLHTNDAVTSIPRLLDMKIPPFLISSTLNLIIAQRLVRKICKDCMESYQPDKKTMEDLEQQFNLDNLEAALKKGGHLSEDDSIKSTTFYHGKGCPRCSNSGYRGRIGIYETLEINEEISKLITGKASLDKLEIATKKLGMTTILQDGFIKAKDGITSLEEVLRVTRE
jgi:type IV pilus assembly protein PilB